MTTGPNDTRSFARVTETVRPESDSFPGNPFHPNKGTKTCLQRQDYQEEAQMTNLEIGTPAPDFALQDCYDKTVSLGDLRGKKVLLYFFTSSGGGN